MDGLGVARGPGARAGHVQVLRLEPVLVARVLGRDAYDFADDAGRALLAHAQLGQRLDHGQVRDLPRLLREPLDAAADLHLLGLRLAEALEPERGINNSGMQMSTEEALSVVVESMLE